MIATKEEQKMAKITLKLIEAMRVNASSKATQPYARDELRKLIENAEKMAKEILNPRE